MASTKKKPSKHRITLRERRWRVEYLKTKNATEAAIRAGYSAKTATTIGSALFRQPYTQQWLKEVLSKQEKRTEITADRTLKEIARVAFLDPRKVYREDGTLLPVPQMGDDEAAALSEFEETVLAGDDKSSIRTKKIKFHSKIQALDQLAKHFKLYVDTPPPPVNPETPAVTFPVTSEELHELVRRRMQKTRTENLKKSGRKG